MMDTKVYTTKIGKYTVTLCRCDGFNPSPETLKCKEAYYVAVDPSRTKAMFSDYLWPDGTVHAVASTGKYEGWFASIRAARAAITQFRQKQRATV